MHGCPRPSLPCHNPQPVGPSHQIRSEEHTSELQSRLHIVCRLLLEDKKTPSARAHPCRKKDFLLLTPSLSQVAAASPNPVTPDNTTVASARVMRRIALNIL